jgi:23S rRNA (adenine2503-C2)-methyltransferase
MTQNELFQLSANRVTVSTVAPTPQSFAEFGDSRCVLAWSVHAARDELRKQLVPTTKYTMAELRDGLIETLRNRRLRTCMIEVALMDGVNDSIREADEMAGFISYISNSVPGSKLICNLIPYNDIGAVATTTSMGYFRKPTMERVLAFQQRLQTAGIHAYVRGTRGDDESAACGQLVTSRKKKETVMEV